MKRWTWLLTAGAAGCLVLASPRTGLADEQGWGLALRSPHLGMLYLYVTPQGFALVYPKTGAKFVTHSPNWKLVMYNDKTRTYYVETLQQARRYTQNKEMKNLRERAKLNSTRRGPTGMMANTHVTQYFINASSSNGPKQVEAWITTEIHPPKEQFKQLISKLFELDTSNFPDGMPLQVKVAEDSGRKNTLYETIKVEPQQIRTASFTYPADYQHVSSELEVFVDEQSRRKMESILEDSDELTSLLGSAGSKSSSSMHTSRPGYASPGYANYNYGGNRPALTRPAAVAPRPTTTTAATTTPAAKNNNDWWGNLMNSFGGKK